MRHHTAKLRLAGGLALATLTVLAAACGPTETMPPEPGAVLVAVGDIACPPGEPEQPARCRHARTARVAADLRPDAVAVLGDTQYDAATLEELRGSFEPTWGRLRAPIRPAVGNHEYRTEDASGYFEYFGPAAGRPGRAWYSYDVGDWHVVVLDSNCGGDPQAPREADCRAGSPQERWLRADLAAHPRRCTLAYWHHPRFSSGDHGEYASVEPLWRALYDGGAELLLVGHDHDYERFAPQDADGSRDPARGIRQIVVGTGGEELRPFGSVAENSERRNAETFGVLALTLRPDAYSWRFVPEPGRPFTDVGSDRCH